MTIEAQAPGRVVLIGDHTDHAGGVTLAMAIDLATTVRVEQGGARVRLRSDALGDEVDLPLAAASSTTGPGPGGWARMVRAVVDEVGPSSGVDGRVTSTVPLGAGLSSSAAFELSLALALGFDGSPLELAQLGQRAEHRAVGVPCGLLDQLTSACGIEGHALLLDLADATVTPVTVPDSLEVVVVHSGQERALEATPYGARRAQCEAAAEQVGPLPAASAAEVERLADPELRRRARHVVTECARVRAAGEALVDGDGATLGRLMVESHRSLRDDFEVSTPILDEIVSRLMDLPGVHGARLTGAGFGGCVVAVAERGAVPDPSAITGRGWRVRPAAGARRTQADDLT